MTPLKDAPEIFIMITKAATFKNGSLALMAAATAPPLTEIIDLVMGDAPLRDVLMPFVIAAISFIIYLLAYGLDFWSGIKASKAEANGAPDYIKSDKLWSSIYKLLAILLILFALCVFAFVFVILDVSLLYKFFLYSIAAVGIMAFLFDMHSVGENYKRRFKAKPRLFEWLDQMTGTINETIIAKIKNTFK